MAERKFDNSQAQANYLENMSLLIWQNHIIKVDKKKGVIILGVEMEGIPYFREIDIKQFGKWIENDTLYEELDQIIKILSGEVIKWREEKEGIEYKNWEKKQEKGIETLENDSLKDFLNELEERIKRGGIKPLQIIDILRKYNGNKHGD